MNSFRAAARMGKSFGSGIGRSAFRRFESNFAGAQDNAFNRERANVKAHAAATTGT